MRAFTSRSSCAAWPIPEKASAQSICRTASFYIPISANSRLGLMRWADAVGRVENGSYRIEEYRDISVLGNVLRSTYLIMADVTLLCFWPNVINSACEYYLDSVLYQCYAKALENTSYLAIETGSFFVLLLAIVLAISCFVYDGPYSLDLSIPII